MQLADGHLIVTLAVLQQLGDGRKRLFKAVFYWYIFPVLEAD